MFRGAKCFNQVLLEIKLDLGIIILCVGIIDGYRKSSLLFLVPRILKLYSLNYTILICVTNELLLLLENIIL